MNHPHWLPRLTFVLALIACLFLLVFAEERTPAYLALSGLLGASSLLLALILHFTTREPNT